VERLRSAGYARGASLDNTVCLADDGILNPEACAAPTSSSAIRPWTPWEI